jgi:hypothetical protein
MERIITNLAKVKLKLDEAFFYLDEIEELIQEDSISQEAGAKVSAAGERLAGELSSLSARVVELQEILEVLKAQEADDTGGACACEEPDAPAGGDV